jgi:hypothetical protein
VEFDGEEVQIPKPVPTLTQRELDQVLRGKVTDAVVEKAVAHARDRMSRGLPPFAD